MPNENKQTILETLVERGTRYGSFETHADLSQHLKDVMRSGSQWAELAYDQREALEMVVHKIARILNGDPNYADSWHDISGYVTLVEERLNKEQVEDVPPEESS